MEINIKLNIPEDFRMLCDIFQLEPERVMQKFVNKISFPFFYTQPNGDQRWATLFLLDYLDMDYVDDKNEMELHRPYLEKLTTAMLKDLKESPVDIDGAEITARNIMKQWHRFILAERAKYLIDKL